MDKTVRFPQLLDQDWLRQHYVDKQLSSVQIAEQLGCSPANVQIRLRQFGIKARGRWSGRWNPKVCKRCDATYTPSGPAQEYCSGACQAGTAKCEWCGVEFTLRPPKRIKGRLTAVYPNRFHSRECQYAWQSEHQGRILNKDGYVLIKRPPTGHRRVLPTGYVLINMGAGTPGITRKDGRILEHIFVMQQILGRELKLGENVHHKNGDKQDNRPGNLELWSVHQPPGQRIHEKAPHCQTCTCFNARRSRNSQQPIGQDRML